MSGSLVPRVGLYVTSPSVRKAQRTSGFSLLSLPQCCGKWEACVTTDSALNFQSFEHMRDRMFVVIVIECSRKQKPRDSRSQAIGNLWVRHFAFLLEPLAAQGEKQNSFARTTHCFSDLN